MADDLAGQRPFADHDTAPRRDPSSHPLPPGAPLRPPLPSEVIDRRFARRPEEPSPLVLPPPQKERGSGAFWAGIAVVVAAIAGVCVWVYQTQDLSFTAGAPQRASSPAADVPATAPPTAPPTTVPTTTSPPTTTLTPLPAIATGAKLPPWEAERPAPLAVYRYSVVYFDEPRLDAPHVEFRVEYAPPTDEAAMLSLDHNGEQLRREFYLGEWVHRRSGPGEYARSPRSPESLEPRPDHRLARGLSQVDVIPNSVAALATVAGGFTDDMFGEELRYTLLDFDTRAFASRQPDEFRNWTIRWGYEDMVDPAPFAEGVQVASVPEFDYGSSVANPNMDMLADIAGDVIRADAATVLMGLRRDGTLAAAVVHDPFHGIFTMYLLSSNAEYQTLSTPNLELLTEAAWVDAP